MSDEVNQVLERYAHLDAAFSDSALICSFQSQVIHDLWAALKSIQNEVKL